MAATINLEREFFRIAKDLDNYTDIKDNFLSRITQISKEWIDEKFRLGICGLK